LAGLSALDIRVVEETEKTLGRLIHFDRETLRQTLAQKVKSSNLEKLKRDVAPFLENPDILSSLFDPARLLRLIETLRFWRPYSEKELARKICTLSAIRAKSWSEWAGLFKKQYADLQDKFLNEGLLPDPQQKNSLEDYLEVVFRHFR
jgi:hypothetical protein